MDKIHNLIASVTGQEKIGFIDSSQTSLYGKLWFGGEASLEAVLTPDSGGGSNSLQPYLLEVSLCLCRNKVED